MTQKTILLAALALSAAAAAAAQKASYVGSKTCLECHTDYEEWIRGSVHQNVTRKAADGRQVAGCEVCHGPGSVHAEDPTVEGAILPMRPGKNVKATVDACLNCHNALFPELSHRRSDHIRRGLSCTDCHAAAGSEAFHRMRAVNDVMGGQQPRLCYRCHTDERAGFLLPYHHPVEERYMECTDCHDPHGVFELRQLKTRHTEPVCTRCHEDQQGPFVFEHPPGRASGCQVCHEPHGSTNAKMLIRPKVMFLCLECHADTPAFHDVTRTEFQNCTACHSRIHGSNLNRNLLE